jgi:hypothetical protein
MTTDLDAIRKATAYWTEPERARVLELCDAVEERDVRIDGMRRDLMKAQDIFERLRKDRDGLAAVLAVERSSDDSLLGVGWNLALDAVRAAAEGTHDG